MGKTAYPLRNAFGDNGNRLDLRVLQQLHGGAVDRSGGSKVDNGVNIIVLGHCLVHILVDGQESLAGSPVPEIELISTGGGND